MDAPQQRWLSYSSFTLRLSPSFALPFLAGVVAVQCLSKLPPQWLVIVLFAMSVAVFWRYARLRWIAFFIVGFTWSSMRADFALSSRLPSSLEGQDLQVIGMIIDLPKSEKESTRFDLLIGTASLTGKPIPFSGRVRLNWYKETPTLSTCSRWQLTVKLKRPRGLINPGNYDFERQALEQNINAVGYVRESVNNRVLDNYVFCVDGWREQLSQGIATALGNSSVTPLLRALAVGDQRWLEDQHWKVLRATGIGHLIAISGMHIGMFAGLGVLFMRLLWWLQPHSVTICPAPMLEAVAGLICATAYSALAGFGLPTWRTLVMIGVVVMARVLRRALAPAQGLSLALVVLLIINPLSVLNAGFWLSFVGVAWLIFCLDRGEPPNQAWHKLISAQAVMTIGLLPLTVWFFGNSSIVGPLANLIAVPWVSFVVVPLTVAGGLLLTWIPLLGEPIIKIAALAMEPQWWLLEKFSSWPFAQWYLPESSIFALIMAVIGAIWLLLPRGIPARALGNILFLPLLWPTQAPLAEGEFETVMLDVGQGLSVLVRTRYHTLLYDAGASFPSGFDLGQVAVVPALHALGVTHLERLVISHGDNDHAGGAKSVVDVFPPDRGISSEPERLKIAADECQAGEEWSWDEVSFKIVHPTAGFGDQGNDSSCVLAVRSGESELVLTGDISANVERGIAAALEPVASKLILVVPHHGSKTSSSDSLLSTLKPDLALVSAGYRSRFGHPNPQIIKRYQQASIPMLNTADVGFVRLRANSSGQLIMIEQGRLTRHPYWRE